MLRRIERPTVEVNVVGVYDNMNVRLAEIGARTAAMQARMQASLYGATPSNDWQLAVEEQEAGSELSLNAAAANQTLTLGPLSPGLELGWKPRRAPGACQGADASAGSKAEIYF